MFLLVPPLLGRPSSGCSSSAMPEGRSRAPLASSTRTSSSTGRDRPEGERSGPSLPRCRRQPESSSDYGRRPARTSSRPTSATTSSSWTPTASPTFRSTSRRAESSSSSRATGSRRRRPGSTSRPCRATSGCRRRSGAASSPPTRKPGGGSRCGSTSPCSASRLRSRGADLTDQVEEAPAAVASLVPLFQRGLEPVRATRGALTDDHAPVEWLTDRMIIEHIARGGDLDEELLPTAP